MSTLASSSVHSSVAIASSSGRLVKRLSPSQESSGSYGFHSVFGFIAESELGNRVHRRARQGLKTQGAWAFRFQIQPESNQVLGVENCKAESLGSGRWKLATPQGSFELVRDFTASSVAIPGFESVEDTSSEKSKKIFRGALLLSLLLCLTLPWIHGPESVVEPEVLEPVAVRVIPEVQKSVRVPQVATMTDIKAVPKANQETKRAIQQNLGFLGLLGRKDLNKAIGGAPTQLKDASAGAGAGGKEGSGGEYLVGLGQGVKHATVGNTGLAGLGGVGTKGAGGGAGGYGNTLVGSGEGRGLSKIALSNEMILEGGLDRAVIQATIAKYLSQVRACYEEGLQKNSGLSGQVTMDFVIGGEGMVKTANVQKSTLGSPPVESCIATRMRSWQFPKPVGGVNVKVNYPFLLRPIGA